MKYQNVSGDDIPQAIREILKAEQFIEESKEEYSDDIRKIKKLKRGLFIDGITGSGKTHTLYAVRSVLKSWGKTTAVENWVKLLFELKRDNFSRVDSLIKNMIESDYIFIDDVGAENQSGWNQEILYLILDQAYIHEKKLFMTTNLTEDEFTEKYGNRLASRIGEMCVRIEMPNKDWRAQ